MNRFFSILLMVAILMTIEGKAVTKERLQKMDTIFLLPLYYGSLEFDAGTTLWRGKNLDAHMVRDELLSRPDLTDVLMDTFREGIRSAPYFCYSLVALGEFGTPSDADQEYVLSVIKEVLAKREQDRVTRAELDSHDGMVLMGAGAYLAGRQSAESEPILLDMLRRGDWMYLPPFTLRMLEMHPTRERLEALRNRDYGSQPLTEYKKTMRSWVDTSILKIEATLREAEEAQPESVPYSEPLPIKPPQITPRNEVSLPTARVEPSSSSEATYGLGACGMGLLAIIGILLWKRRI